LPPLCGVSLGPLPAGTALREGRFQTLDVGITVRRALGQALEDDRVEFRRHVRTVSRRRRRLLIQVCGQGLYGGAAGERRLPRYQEVRERANAVDVAAGVEDGHTAVERSGAENASMRVHLGVSVRRAFEAGIIASCFDIYEYNYFTVERFKIAGKDKLTPGNHTIRLEFKYDGGNHLAQRDHNPGRLDTCV
jgi:hypothetical protein